MLVFMVFSLRCARQVFNPLCSSSLSEIQNLQTPVCKILDLS